MIKTLHNKILGIFAAQHDRLILWVPVIMGFGVAWYFHLSHEPPAWLGAAGMLLFALLALAIRRTAWSSPVPGEVGKAADRSMAEQNPSRPDLPPGGKGIIVPFARNDLLDTAFYLCLIAAFFFLGVTLAQFRTHRVHSPALAVQMGYADVSGAIAEIAPTPKGAKLLLEEVTIAGLAAEKTPVKVSVTWRSYDPELVTGQKVHLHAGLFPPPSPAFPGGFDFSRYFYFREVGAVGYGIGALEVKPPAISGMSPGDLRFAEFRHRLTESIRSYFHEPAGAVAAAFITGETRTIPDSVNDDMRTAGLYHLLAVSGMNLSVVAGLAFFSFRFLLASIPALALRFNIKKWAAALALIASYAYLRVSGSPVSAERAFFMVSLIFIAILLDRDPTPMRSVAIAAFFLILYEPEEALTASFELSFSATAALIASYEWGVVRFATYGEPGFGIRKLALYFAAVMATALVAWLATEPFIIYHFNQFSSYSLIANTIAEPLVSFLLMPFVIAGVLLMPLHLAWLAFTPMQYGVDLLLAIAHFVASLPHAMWILPSPADYGFALVVLGCAWIYFWRSHLRWLGLIFIIPGMATAFLYVPPDLFVSGDGKHVAARLDDGQTAMIRGKATSVLSQQWAHAAIAHALAGKEAAGAKCDRKGCAFTARGHKVAALREADAVAEECGLSDIVIVSDKVANVCSGATLIDAGRLNAWGATTLWYEGRELRMRHVREEQGNRPWVTDGASEE